MKTLKNIQYDVYMIILVALTLLSYTGKIGVVILPLFIMAMLWAIFFKLPVFYLIPFPFFIHMGFSGFNSTESLTSTYLVIVSSLVVFDLIKNRYIKHKGKLFWPFMLFIMMSIFTGLFFDDWYTTLAGFMEIIVVYLLYFYFINVIEPGEKDYINLSKLFLYMGVLVSLEMAYVVHTNDASFETMIMNRAIDLGWENLNIIIYPSLVAIPLFGYLITKVKFKLYYLLLGLIMVVGIFLTLSRSSILSVGVYVLLLVPFVFHFEKHKVSLLIQAIVFFGLIGLAYWYFDLEHFITTYVNSLIDRDLLHNDDRIMIWQIAYETFLKYPLTGSNGLFSSRIYLESTGALNYHNTIFQASTLGVTGVIALFYLLYKKIRLILSESDSFRYFVVILVAVTMFVNGMFQPMYFFATYMMYLFFILGVMEAHTNQ